MARGNANVMGTPYKIFHWTPDFDEDPESPLVHVWISLLGLPLNYFYSSILKSIGGGFGRFLTRDNATTASVLRLEDARI